LVIAKATPLATKTVRAMVANNNMVRLIRRAAFRKGAGEMCKVTPTASRSK